ncbi:MAG: lysophospholipid acyltransferase family protein [Myxococcota bacterium]
MRATLSVFFWGFILASSLVLFPLAVLIFLLTAPFDRRRVVLHRFTSFWASLYTWLNPVWNVTIHGRDRLHEAGPAVVVANHLSLLDILVMFRLQSHFKWVSKVENFRVPLIGWNMTLCGYIPLRRGTRASVMAMMRACDDALAQGSSIVMFPEGTRSASGRLRAFKPGAFEIAQRNAVPIQPLVIRGTGDALPKRGFVLQGRHAISIEILDVIPPEDVEKTEPEVMMDRVRERIADALASQPG